MGNEATLQSFEVCRCRMLCARWAGVDKIVIYGIFPLFDTFRAAVYLYIAITGKSRVCLEVLRMPEKCVGLTV